MSLTPEQKAAVSSWIVAGDNLSAVQKKLRDQFQVSMTYMDVRFLVDDLNLTLKDPTPKADVSDVTKAKVPSAPAAAKPAPAPAAEKKGLLDKAKEKLGLGAKPAAEEDELPADDAAALDDEAEAPLGGVTVDVDRVVRPGAVVSGTVTFSDGVSGKWALDQYGRLMLDTGQPGYKPAPADVQAFQRELQMQLQRHGF